MHRGPDPRPKQSRWLRAESGLLALLGVGALAMTALRFIVITGPGPAIQSLYPLAGGLSVLLFIWRGWRRQWRGMLLIAPAAVCALILSAQSVRATTVPAGPNDLVVMAQNLYFGQADTDALVREVRERQPDLLILPEATQEAMSRLRRSGLDQLLPYQVGRLGAGADGTAIRSRYPLTVRDDDSLEAFGQPTVSLRWGNRDITVRAVHTQSPSPMHSGGWRTSLVRLRDWVQQQPADTPLLLAGDFNASTAHRAYREAVDGLVDAHAATGAGYVRTWPRESIIPPFVHLDHVLVRGLGVVDAGVFSVPDTDHAGVWARVSLPPAGVASAQPSVH